MTIPTKTEIESKARELYFKAERDQYITPTKAELAESGYTHEARNQLMTNQEKHEVMAYLEQMANENGYTLVKEKPKTKIETIQNLLVDTTEAMKTGISVFGGRQSGKSNLGKLIAQKLIDKGIIVFVVDPTAVWFDLGLPTICLNEPKGKQTIQWQDRSTLFDVSRLSPYWQQRFIEDFNREIIEVAIRRGKQAQPKTFIFYEEAHTPMPNHILNSKDFRQTKRLLTQGANFNVSFCAITQFASMIDKLPVKAAQQRFFGRTSEYNDLRYLKAYLGDRVNELKTLKTGEFLYTFGSETKKIQTPKFEAKKVIA